VKVPAADIEALTAGTHGRPFDVLGIHPVTIDGRKGMAIRAFLPNAESVVVERGTSLEPMTRVTRDGFFEALFPGTERVFPYRLLVTGSDGLTVPTEDPYRFPAVLSEYDLHLFKEGNHFRLYEKLGAHRTEIDGVAGVSFAVWAPNARQVSLIGSFNRWDERIHMMRPRGSTGVWEIFIPGLQPGALYKYRIRSRHRDLVTIKADPYGFFMERRPETASIVWDLHNYVWQDAEWMATRSQRQALDTPIAIYEVHLGSWKRDEREGSRWLTYRELADELVPYAREMGYTHLELLPITEHPFDGSWGYQTVGYFAPTSRYGTPDDFRHFVDTAHQAGLGIILDWVPAHFPKDAHGLGFFDGTHLYEHADPRKGQHQDWGTFIYNFSRPEVSAFLITNALFWLDIYHLDGLRVDAVASMLYLDYSRKEGEWEPNEYGGRENLEAVEFLKRFNVVVHEKFPDVLTFAEESTSWPMVSRPVYLGGLGFDIKWNMGWMHDMLEFMSQDPIYRRYIHNKLTFSLFYAFSENFLLPLSHDEVVHGKGSLVNKMPGDYWRRFANLRSLYAYMYAHPGKKLLFMGGEIGQWKEWNHDAAIDWVLLDFEMHRGLKDFVRDLNHFYQKEPSLWQIDFTWEGFQWIDFRDVDRSVVSFFRRARDPEDAMVVVANFTPVVQEGYRIGVPSPGRYIEVLNSDSSSYGGSGVINEGEFETTEGDWQGQPHSICVTLPPLGVVFLKAVERSAVAHAGQSIK
jgi:1,4-alpha-glucan branching enzyme